MDKRTKLIKFLISLVVVAALTALLSGVIGGELIYPV